MNRESDYRLVIICICRARYLRSLAGGVPEVLALNLENLIYITVASCTTNAGGADSSCMKHTLNFNVVRSLLYDIILLMQEREPNDVGE